MRVLELMERLRVNDTGFIIAYIEDAFVEIQELSRENKKEGKISIVSGVEDYHFPADMINLVRIAINDNDEQSYNDEKWRWNLMGRTFKLWMLDDNSDWEACDISVTDGIELEYTSRGYVFVRNPDGDAGYYTHLASTGSQSLVQDTSIVFLDSDTYDRADRGTRGYYYKYLGTSGAVDTSDANFTDTTTWEDVTEISSPDENSYINSSDVMLKAIEQYVRAKISDAGGDIKMTEYRRSRFRKDLERTVSNRMGPWKYARPPRSPFRLGG